MLATAQTKSQEYFGKGWLGIRRNRGWVVLEFTTSFKIRKKFRQEFEGKMVVDFDWRHFIPILKGPTYFIYKPPLPPQMAFSNGHQCSWTLIPARTTVYLKSVKYKLNLYTSLKFMALVQWLWEETRSRGHQFIYLVRILVPQLRVPHTYFTSSNHLLANSRFFHSRQSRSTRTLLTPVLPS